MWRAIPLTKILVRMLIFGVALGVALGLFTIVAFESSIPSIRAYHPQLIKGEAVNGVILGALIGIALALYTGVIHRTTHKPFHFKFAFVILATIVSLAVVQEPFHIVTMTEQLGIPVGEWFPWVLSNPVLGPVLFATIAKHAAVGLMSLYVASRYLREASAPPKKITEQLPI